MGRYDEINAAALARARAAGWPELTGTDRQIGYANTLREERMREYGADLAAATLSEANKTLLRQAMLRETRAEAWIELSKAEVKTPGLAWGFIHLTEEERAAFSANRNEAP